MQLIKFCKSQHNIHRGAKLQLGTLYGYRSIEDPAIRDAAEGTYEFTIEFPEEITLDRQWCNLLFQGSFAFGQTNDTPRFQGGFSTHAERLTMVRQNEDSVVLKNTLVRIKRNINNCFIFCMSLKEDAKDKLFTDYDDYWAFSADKANEFSQRLGSLVFQQAKLVDFDDMVSKIHSPATASRLSLNVKHKKVTYRSRHLKINPGNIPSFGELVQVLSDIEFLKPESFQHENEYRFVFDLNDGQRTFSPKSKNLLLTLNPLADL
jgi:hypothetical protein